MSRFTFALVCVLLTTVITPGLAAEPVYEVVPASDVVWEHLNPARGDASPRAGTLWGDRNGTEATGFLVRFVDGFSSPPHIHNVSYRGVVISGLLHNDDPEAAPMWMPAGSFWTQPAGEVHITAASGNENVAIIEIEEGPYLVKPVTEAFDNGERPINVDASNIVWVDLSGPAGNAKTAYLWGDPNGDASYGSLVRLSAGFAGEIRSHGATFRAVVIQGRIEHRVPDEGEIRTLETGSYFGSKDVAAHRVSSPDQETIIYVSAGDIFDVVPAEAGK